MKGGSDLDMLIEEINQPRDDETEDIPIGILLLNGEKVKGILIRHAPNVFYVKDWNDGLKKEIHRATIRCFILLLDGGIDARTGREKKN